LRESYCRSKAKAVKKSVYCLRLNDWGYLKGENGWGKFADLDGKTFEDPDFDDFFPHIGRLNLGGCQLGADTTRTKRLDVPGRAAGRSDSHAQDRIGRDRGNPGAALSGPDRGRQKAEAELLRTRCKACWAEIESIMPLDRLRSGTTPCTLRWRARTPATTKSPRPHSRMNSRATSRHIWETGSTSRPCSTAAAPMAPQRHESRPRSISYPPDGHTNGRR